MTAVHVGIVVVATAAAVVFPLLVEGGGGPAVGGPLLPLLLPRVARQLEGGDTEGQAQGHHTTRPPTSLLLHLRPRYPPAHHPTPPSGLVGMALVKALEGDVPQPQGGVVVPDVEEDLAGKVP